MKLTDLDATFLRIIPTGFLRTESIEGVDGVMFLCPLCFDRNRGAVGTHSVICWQPHVPQDVFPKPGRWNLIGTGLADLSLRNGSSSIQLPDNSRVDIPGDERLYRDPCGAHFFVTNGETVMA